MQNLEKRIAAIEARNQKVEREKAWEVSWTRRVALAVLTYIVIFVLMWSMDIPSPFRNAVIPAVALILSGPTLNVLKNIWIKYMK